MMRLTILTLLFLISSQVFAQSYVGLTLGNVNLRSGPSVADSTIVTIPRYSNIHLYSDSVYNDSFYKVKYLAKDLVGYVACKYVHVHDSVKSEGQSVLTEFKIKEKQPYIQIENKAGVDITVTMNGVEHVIPKDTMKKIKVSPGLLILKATAKGKLPYESEEIIKEGHAYGWVFITTIKGVSK